MYILERVGPRRAEKKQADAPRARALCCRRSRDDVNWSNSLEASAAGGELYLSLARYFAGRWAAGFVGFGGFFFRLVGGILTTDGNDDDWGICMGTFLFRGRPVSDSDGGRKSLAWSFWVLRVEFA